MNPLTFPGLFFFSSEVSVIQSLQQFGSRVLLFCCLSKVLFFQSPRKNTSLQGPSTITFSFPFKSNADSNFGPATPITHRAEKREWDTGAKNEGKGREAVEVGYWLWTSKMAGSGLLDASVKVLIFASPGVIKINEHISLFLFFSSSGCWTGSWLTCQRWAARGTRCLSSSPAPSWVSDWVMRKEEEKWNEKKSLLQFLKSNIIWPELRNNTVSKVVVKQDVVTPWF